MDIQSDAEAIARNLRFATMASADPQFPPDLRRLVVPAAEHFTGWAADVERVLDPVARIVDRTLLHGGPVPALRGALRLV